MRKTKYTAATGQKTDLRLDSLCWFSQRRSRTPHFWGCAPRAAKTPKFTLGWDFSTMHLPAKFHHPMYTRSEVIVLTNKQTNRRRWKHPTLFARLRRWVKLMISYNRPFYYRSKWPWHTAQIDLIAFERRYEHRLVLGSVVNETGVQKKISILVSFIGPKN